MTAAIETAFDDLRDGLSRFAFWRFIALQDIRLRYARSVIGPFWLSLTMAAWVAAMTLVFGGLFGAPMAVVAPYITAGVILWSFLASVLNESALCLLQYRGYIMQSRLPVTAFVFVVMLKNIMITAHYMVVMAAVVVIFKVWPNSNTLWLFITTPLFVIAVFGLCLIAAVLTPRFRDLSPFITSMTTVGFFLTPVMWRPADLQSNHFIAAFNPFTHMLEVVRAPILGDAPSMLSLQVTAVFAAGAVTLGMAVLAATRKRIAFWI